MEIPLIPTIFRRKEESGSSNTEFPAFNPEHYKTYLTPLDLLVNSVPGASFHKNKLHRLSLYLQAKLELTQDVTNKFLLSLSGIFNELNEPKRLSEPSEIKLKDSRIISAIQASGIKMYYGPASDEHSYATYGSIVFNGDKWDLLNGIAAEASITPIRIRYFIGSVELILTPGNITDTEQARNYLYDGSYKAQSKLPMMIKLSDGSTYFTRQESNGTTVAYQSLGKVNWDGRECCFYGRTNLKPPGEKVNGRSVTTVKPVPQPV